MRLFHDGLTPVARNRLNPNWIRLHEDQVFYYRSPNHGYRYVFTISFRFATHDNEHQFALFYPYNYTTLANFLNRWSIEATRRRKQQLQAAAAARKSFRNDRSATTRSVTPSSSRVASRARNGQRSLRTSSRLSPDYYTHDVTHKQHRLHTDDDPSSRCHSSIGFTTQIKTPTPIPTTNTTTFGRRTRDITSPPSASRKTNQNKSSSYANCNREATNLFDQPNDDDDDDFKLPDAPNICIQSIATTILNKCIYRVSIRSAQNDNLFSADHHVAKKPNVVILCRPAGNQDAAASYLCQGLIDYAMSDFLMAKLSRKYLNIDVFPMLDPDSVWVGNTRTDLFGQLSGSQRVARKNPNLYAGQLAVYEHIINLISGKEESNFKFDNNAKELPKQQASLIIIDLHVNLSLIGSRVIGTYYNEPLRMERHLSFPRLLTQFSQDFYLENCEFIPSNLIPSGLFDFKQHHLVDQYRFEVSPFASFKRSLAERSYDELTPTKYFALAKAIVFTLLEMVRIPKRAGQADRYLEQLLKAFHQGPSDIDDLRLNLNEVE